MTATTARAPARPQVAASHRQGHAVRPLLDLATFGPIEHVVTELQARIRRTLYSRGEGTVVMCSPEGKVYALMDGELRTDRFVQEHPTWVVGTYANRPKNPKFNPTVPSAEVLRDDLEDHTRELR